MAWIILGYVSLNPETHWLEAWPTVWCWKLMGIFSVSTVNTVGKALMLAPQDGPHLPGDQLVPQDHVIREKHRACPFALSASRPIRAPSHLPLSHIFAHDVIHCESLQKSTPGVCLNPCELWVSLFLSFFIKHPASNSLRTAQNRLRLSLFQINE